ncbi:ligase [Vibrio albus]|uniref:Ligase n=1 Tax=Vibrio albus TaxID=2200953 RepID=A0A2U3B5F9_9VIBR|nr:PglL family O-oligosaccharyltransferase [Vibrio albus]PWI32030.1 ligase [Vibrio albus]
MAIIHVSGTQLEPKKVLAPLNRDFRSAFGFIFIIAMHFFMNNPGGYGISISFNATSWIGIALAMGIGLIQMARNQKVRFSKLTIGLLVSCLLMTLPVLYTNAVPNAVMPRLSGLWSGFLLFLFLQQFHLSNKYKQQLLWLIVIATLIESAFGYVQFFFLPPDNIFDFDVTADRPYGIFQQPNVMASFLATGLVLSGYLLARQQKKYGRKLSHISLLYLVPLITVPLLVILASRTGWLGALLGVLTIFPYLYRFSTRKRLFGWSLSILFGLASAIVILNTSDQASDMVTQKANLQGARPMIYSQTLDMLIEKPFTGYGYGRFEAAYTLYTARQHQLNSTYPAGMQTLTHPHNELLFWGVEGGALPLLGIFLAASFVLLKIISARQGTRLAMLGLFIPITLHSQLEYPFYHSVIHWIIFIIFIFWVDQRTAKYYFSPFSNMTRVVMKTTGGILPLLVTAYMLTALQSNYVLTRFEKATTRDPNGLSTVSNPFAWKTRLDWDIYSTSLAVGLKNSDPNLITPYVEWSQKVIKQKPRVLLYSNLILAYLAIGEQSKAEQIQAEAEFLFPDYDLTDLEVNIWPEEKSKAKPVTEKTVEGLETRD